MVFAATNRAAAVVQEMNDSDSTCSTDTSELVDGLLSRFDLVPAGSNERRRARDEVAPDSPVLGWRAWPGDSDDRELDSGSSSRAVVRPDRPHPPAPLFDNTLALPDSRPRPTDVDSQPSRRAASESTGAPRLDGFSGDHLGYYLTTHSQPAPRPPMLDDSRRPSDAPHALADSPPPSSLAFARPRKTPSHADLPMMTTVGPIIDIDPSTYPDPYPSHAWHSPVPALSSGSSNSARSSAYTNPSSNLRNSGDSVQLHVAVVVGEEHEISPNTYPHHVDPMFHETSVPITKGHTLKNSFVDTSHWSSSASHPDEENFTIKRSDSKTFNGSWDVAFRSEDGFSVDADSDDDDDKVEFDADSVNNPPSSPDRTAAAVVAEEGRGTILNVEGIAVHQIPQLSGVTHLLLSSSTTPNALPPYLVTVLPTLSSSLLALDISANFLLSLPASLSTLTVLEELNVSSNPLRALPTFLVSLQRSLRILIADSCGLSGLPTEMSCMKRLTVLSLRRNKLYSVPDVIAGMDSLEDLRLEGNSFLGPWKALVDPILQLYNTPQTAILPPLSAPVLNSDQYPTSTSDDDSPIPGEEEHTIRASLREAIPSSSPPISDALSFGDSKDVGTALPLHDTRSLVRTRTAPGRPPNQRPITPDHRIQTRSHYQESSTFRDTEGRLAVRRMKSANELRDLHHRKTSVTSARQPHNTIVSRAASQYLDDQTAQKTDVDKFGSISARTALSIQMTSSDDTKHPSDVNSVRTVSSRAISPIPPRSEPGPSIAANDKRDASSKSKWGFFKKMSMKSLRTDVPAQFSPPRTRERPNITQIATVPLVPRIAEVSLLNTPSSSPIRAGKTTTRNIFSPEMTLPRSAPPEANLARTPSSNGISAMLSPTTASPTAGFASRRRSFLPIDLPSALHIPPRSPVAIIENSSPSVDRSSGSAASLTERQERLERDERERFTHAKQTLMAYLRDMLDLNAATMSYPVAGSGSTQPLPLTPTLTPTPQDPPIVDRPTMSRRPTLSEASSRFTSDASFSSVASTVSAASSLMSAQSMTFRDVESVTNSNPASLYTSDSDGVNAGPSVEERRSKDDKNKRTMIIREIVETERTYVKGLQELSEIYIKPAAAPVTALGASAKETVIPAAERKIVFSGLDGLCHFHRENFLPALESAAASLLQAPQAFAERDVDGQMSTELASLIAKVFVSHAAFMKMYSSYINNFDSASQHLKSWSMKSSSTSSAITPPASSNGATHIVAGLGLSMTGTGVASTVDGTSVALTSTQRKRMKSYLKRCRLHPRHSQLNLEGYLLLPVQRIPRYRLLLEELVRSTPPSGAVGKEDPLEKALAEISSLAVNMNEGKRDSESRRKLVQWQSRIRGKFPSPLVQPHRRLIMDGPLHLIRVVRRNSVPFEVLNSDGDAADVMIECLTPEETPRDLIGILCNDLLVLCKDLSVGQSSPASQVDLWAVLRMQTLPQPASVIQGNTLRLVDNKAILYFNAPSTSDALTWSRAINIHIPTVKA